MIAVVIPSYRVRDHVLDVIGAVGPEVDKIYVVDDACPDRSGDFVRSNCRDARVEVLMHPQNQGVGGAVVTGYRKALQDGAEIVLKIDGDGQMDPKLIPEFVRPIVEGKADYVKGNRFYDLESLRSMPKIRIFGNAGLSLITKISTGYWETMDPNNGYTAIHVKALSLLALDKLDRRYFSKAICFSD